MVLDCSDMGMIVRSGEVGCCCCWCCVVGTLVGVSLLIIMCGDVFSISVMCSPLLSVYGEYQDVEWALKSPSMHESDRFSNGVRWVVLCCCLHHLGVFWVVYICWVGGWMALFLF